MVKLPDSTIIQATHKGIIPLHHSLLSQAQQAYSFPKITNSSLISIGQICDDNCTAIFNKQDLKIYKDTDVHIVSGKSIINGTRNDTDGLWDIHIHSNDTQPQIIIRKDKTKMDLATYIHACLFSPPTQTLQQVVCKGHLLSWPGIHDLNFQKLLRTTKATALGLLDQERSNLQSTKQ